MRGYSISSPCANVTVSGTTGEVGVPDTAAGVKANGVLVCADTAGTYIMFGASGETWVQADMFLLPEDEEVWFNCAGAKSVYYVGTSGNLSIAPLENQ